jgi:cell wall-associated NlpC family hydrolase
MKYLSIIFIALLLTGCASQRDSSGHNLPVDSAKANEVMFGAMQQVGKPYRYGGNFPQSGFDCSGLINYVYRESVGLKLPRTVKELKIFPAPSINQQDLQTSDLVIFATKRNGQPDHAGIYVGKGQFVHAPSSGGKVRLDKLSDSYWQRSFLVGKRLLAKR